MSSTAIWFYFILLCCTAKSEKNPSGHYGLKCNWISFTLFPLIHTINVLFNDTDVVSGMSRNVLEQKAASEKSSFNTEQLEMFSFPCHIFCIGCLLLQSIAFGAARDWVGTDYKALPTGSWPTASSTHFSLPTPSTIIAGPLHPSTKMASIHSDAVWLHERVQLCNHGNNKEQEVEKGKRAEQL